MTKLTSRQLTIIDFCDTPRTSDEIADRMGIATNSVYYHLRQLQHLQQIERKQPPGAASNQHCTFVATGKPLSVASRATREPMVVFGVRL